MKSMYDALEALEQVVAEFGDGHVYPESAKTAAAGCVYAQPDGTPMCIVGQALNRWDMLKSLKRVNPWGPAYLNGSIAGLACGPLAAEVSNEAVEVLAIAQLVQDRGDSWGDALIRAKEKANDLLQRWTP